MAISGMKFNYSSKIVSFQVCWSMIYNTTATPDTIKNHIQETEMIGNRYAQRPGSDEYKSLYDDDEKFEWNKPINGSSRINGNHELHPTMSVKLADGSWSSDIRGLNQDPQWEKTSFQSDMYPMNGNFFLNQMVSVFDIWWWNADQSGWVFVKEIAYLDLTNFKTELSTAVNNMFTKEMQLFPYTCCKGEIGSNDEQKQICKMLDYAYDINTDAQNATCLNAFLSQCTDIGLENPACQKFCTNATHCDKALQDYCTVNDHKFETEPLNLKYSQTCGCYRPDSVYNNFFNDLDAKLPNYLTNYRFENCFFPQCSGAKIKPYGAPQCPSIQNCIANIDVNFDGTVNSSNGFNFEQAINCVNGTPTPTPNPNPNPNPNPDPNTTQTNIWTPTTLLFVSGSVIGLIILIYVLASLFHHDAYATSTTNKKHHHHHHHRDKHRDKHRRHHKH
jgi:hypothetical protein